MKNNLKYVRQMWKDWSGISSVEWMKKYGMEGRTGNEMLSAMLTMAIEAGLEVEGGEIVEE